MLFIYVETESLWTFKLRWTAVKEKWVSSNFPEWLASHLVVKSCHSCFLQAQLALHYLIKQAAFKDRVTLRDFGDRYTSLLVCGGLVLPINISDTSHQATPLFRSRLSRLSKQAECVWDGYIYIFNVKIHIVILHISLTRFVCFVR